MRTIIASVVTPLAFFAVAACTTQPPSDSPPVQRTTIAVENQGLLNLNVYVFRGTQRVRLGTVRGATTETLVIPDYLLFGPTPLRFQADPIGARATPATQEVVVNAGDALRWIVRR